MKLGQIKSHGSIVAAIFEDETHARPIPDYSMYDLVKRAEVEGVELRTLAMRLASSHREEVTPLIPIAPKEVWGAGCTYEISSSFRDAEHGTREGFYRAVFEGGRPELFFKGTSRIAVGPGQPIGIREDSKFTAPEPELAVLIGSKGQIFGYTVSNDVSAWDIEKENPLYLPQSKTFTGCAAIGPVFVTPDELGNVYDLEMTCVIHRGDRVTFEGKTSTAKLGRKIEELIGFLLRSNPVPCGTVLQTGTGIIVTQESALAPGDVVTISVPQIGTLSNPAAIV
ncbi:MAG: fumarylacetoacetate hydrolase family protein [Acidobacteriota bacterium]|jgi:2-dehydro-3-deoxy-D-arabinonate dehydratase